VIKINFSEFMKKILMLHFLRLVNYERKRSKNQVDFQDKFRNLRSASIVTLLAINYFKRNSDKFIGKSEKLAAKEIKKFCKQKGYRQGFPLLVASGENTQKIHARATDRIIKKNDIIMIDIGVKRKDHYLSDYCSDCTRTFFLGKPTDYQKEVYDIVKEAHDMALKKVKAGVSGKLLHNLVTKFIISKGYNLPHGLGHSTRRYTHSTPFLSSYDSSSVLKENDNITIEPGIYISKDHPKLPKGHPPFGVRIEDLVIVKKDGFISLTSSKRVKID